MNKRNSISALSAGLTLCVAVAAGCAPGTSPEPEPVPSATATRVPEQAGKPEILSVVVQTLPKTAKRTNILCRYVETSHGIVDEYYCDDIEPAKRRRKEYRVAGSVLVSRCVIGPDGQLNVMQAYPEADGFINPDAAAATYQDFELVTDTNQDHEGLQCLERLDANADYINYLYKDYLQTGLPKGELVG